MTEEPRMKFNDQVAQEAAEWFIEFRTGDVDPAGRRAFDIWVRGSQEHLRAYLETAAIWNECSALDAQRAWDTDALISLADENVVPLAARAGQVRSVAVAEGGGPAARSLTRSRVAAIAASIIVCAAAALLWSQRYGLPTYAADVGEQRTIRLADGSTIELNSRSRVRVHFTQAERGVELLEGQALFHVEKDAARPFIVRSDGTEVRAVGTKFDVNRKRHGTVVTVVEGKVAVLQADPRRAITDGQHPASRATPGAGGAAASIGTPAAAILLSAGEQLSIAAQSAPRPARVNAAAATAWTQGQVVLESAPLAEVAEEFNRYSTRKLVVEERAQRELRLSGVFETDPNFLIRYLRERPDITVHETDTEIRIVRHE